MVKAKTGQNHESDIPFLNEKIVDSYIPGSIKGKKLVFYGTDTGFCLNI